MSQDLGVPPPPKEGNLDDGSNVSFPPSLHSHRVRARRAGFACGGPSQDFDPSGPCPALGVAWPRASIHHQHFWATAFVENISLIVKIHTDWPLLTHLMWDPPWSKDGTAAD
jgi:hypothetical protein